MEKLGINEKLIVARGVQLRVFIPKFVYICINYIIAMSLYLHMENTYSQTCIVHYVTALYVRGKYRTADFQRILSSCRI